MLERAPNPGRINASLPVKAGDFGMVHKVIRNPEHPHIRFEVVGRQELEDRRAETTGNRVVLATDFTTGRPTVIFGTKCPSMTST